MCYTANKYYKILRNSFILSHVDVRDTHTITACTTYTLMFCFASLLFDCTLQLFVNIRKMATLGDKGNTSKNKT